MSKIKILPENLANQIAAGEVVERPASVVKELIENAIDAHANNISIEIEGGGSRLIRIIDNGEGMDQDDLLLCLERHSTSKIQNSKQLFSIKTLGFRGEAIPSIASVSRLTITSRQHEEPLGNRAELKYGSLIKVHEMGSSPGTIIEVKDLFGNLPARKKFLKTKRTELYHIEEIIKNYALLYPGSNFSLIVDKRNIFSCPDPGSLENLFRKIFNIPEHIIPINISNSEISNNLSKISGLLIPPEQVQINSPLRLFVNNRMVKDRMISHAVSEAMKDFLLKGKRPGGVLFVEVAPDSIDVNVHPSKQEIRFHKANLVHEDIVLTIEDAMKKYQDSLRESWYLNKSSEQDKKTEPEKNKQQNNLNSDPRQPLLFSQPPEPIIPVTVNERLPGRESYSNSNSNENNIRSCENEKTSGVSNDSRKYAPEKSINEPCPPPPLPLSQSSKKLKVIGQLLESYILCESINGLIAIDQHAAQERIIFEKLKKQFSGKGLAQQMLMFPVTIELPPSQGELIKNNQDKIGKLGLEIEEFGDETFIIKAIPAIMASRSPEKILMGILSQFSGIKESSQKYSIKLNDILASMACKSALKANHKLTVLEMDVLVRTLEKTNDFFSHCPHGRPVVKYFNNEEIKKWFHRT
jgi:DNA mismatch repair protein MutL